LTVFSDFWPFLWNFIIHTLFHLILRQAHLAKVVCLKYEDNQFKIDFQNKFTLKKNRHEDFGRNKSEIWQYIIGIHNHSNDYDEMGML
jgi:hypothetical protein